jgi:hypothetical protein
MLIVNSLAQASRRKAHAEARGEPAKSGGEQPPPSAALAGRARC